MSGFRVFIFYIPQCLYIRVVYQILQIVLESVILTIYIIYINMYNDVCQIYFQTKLLHTPIDLVPDIACYRLPLFAHERTCTYQDIAFLVYLDRQDSMRGFLPYPRLDFFPLRSRI